ncbi:MAG: glycosyltransferase, partial [Prevotella sp.]|nr:glycosyltransferase [Prevotella sp.]
MPTYNAGKYLADSISSILDQTYLDLELLITDDGSTDPVT